MRCQSEDNIFFAVSLHVFFSSSALSSFIHELYCSIHTHYIITLKSSLGLMVAICTVS